MCHLLHHLHGVAALHAAGVHHVHIVLLPLHLGGHHPLEGVPTVETTGEAHHEEAEAEVHHEEAVDAAHRGAGDPDRGVAPLLDDAAVTAAPVAAAAPAAADQDHEERNSTAPGETCRIRFGYPPASHRIMTTAGTFSSCSTMFVF